MKEYNYTFTFDNFLDTDFAKEFPKYWNKSIDYVIKDAGIDKESIKVTFSVKE
jgi:hypothetical protein